MSRRLRSMGVRLLLQQVALAMRDLLPVHITKIIDSKPLPVGACSKDRDAKRGYAAGEMAKGYKIHAIMDTGGALEAWELHAMCDAECEVAPSLIARCPGSGYLLADAIFDANTVYQAGAQRGWQVVAARQKPAARSTGHRPQCAARLRGLDLLNNPLACCGQGSSFGQDLLALRAVIERRFGFWGNFGGGLSPLPNWVRRPHRVAVWVQAKLLICTARQVLQNKDLAA